MDATGQIYFDDPDRIPAEDKQRLLTSQRELLEMPAEEAEALRKAIEELRKPLPPEAT